MIDIIKKDISGGQKSYKYVFYRGFLDLSIDGILEKTVLTEYFIAFYNFLSGRNIIQETNNSKLLKLIKTYNENQMDNDRDSITNYIIRMPFDHLDTIGQSEHCYYIKDEYKNTFLSDQKGIRNYVDSELVQYYKTKLNQDISDLIGDLKVVQKNNVSKSFFDYGFTIFKENHNIINRINSTKLEKGGKLNVNLTFNNKKYSAELRNINRDVDGDTYQIRYDSQEDLKKHISKYFNNFSKYLHEETMKKSNSKHYVLYNFDDPTHYYLFLIDNKNSIKEKLEIILNRYKKARDNEAFANNPLGDELRNYTPEVIRNILSLNEKFSETEPVSSGSIGQGNWANVPWIGIDFGEESKLLHLGYLFDDKGEAVYLTLMLIVNKLKKNELIKKVSDIRETINHDNFKIDGEINLTNSGIGKKYEYGTVMYKKYLKENIPEDEVLIKDIFDLFDIRRQYQEPDIKEEEIIMDLTKAINKIKKYISIQNFNYEDGMIENFYLSLKTKPFVILAGISGTGKTKLVELFAKAIGCEDNFDIIPVKPDWSDTSDLLGYKNLKGEFNPGPLMDIIVKANADEDDRIHFVCLDEMNLARVEYYFSDFLSIMETRHFDGHKIVSKPLFKEDYFEDDNDDNNSDRKKYAGVYFPQNLYFVGTVNMDETTYPFSKKVLDRGNTIEFSNVDLTNYTLTDAEALYEPIQVENDFLVSEKLTLNDCSLKEKDLIDKVVELLAEVNEILKAESIHFGYRIRDEIVFYMLYNDKYDLLDFDEALDFQLMQKILPRIQGSTESIKQILVLLLEFCGLKNLSSEEGMINYLLTDDKLEACSYKRTALKLAYMIKKLEIDGFTSYWL